MIFEVSNAKLKQNFNPRRFGIHAQKAHIFGAPQSGKTSIALNFARGFKSPLYMDFADLRNTDELIKQTLLKSAFEKKVDLIILDNVPSDFYAPFDNLPAIITISQAKMANLRIDFTPLEIFPLNFEEFISFDSQNLNIKELFERFIRFGNLPFVLNLRDSLKLEAKQKMLISALGENMDIFLTLIRFQSSAVSIFQLYSILKKNSKISKDRIYSVVSEFNERGILRNVAHFKKSNFPKKVYFFDFSLKNALSYERNFIASFENMVFLEILGRNVGEKRNSAEIFYDDKIHLICGNNGYILMPFKSKEMIKDVLRGMDFMGLDIAVLTLDLNDEIKVGGKTIPLISFINFALD